MRRPSLFPMGAAGRQDPRGEKHAHPIELTAVSAIVLDLLSGFQRPSDPDARTLPSRGGPTLLRAGDSPVKPLTLGVRPGNSGAYGCLDCVFLEPGERTRPPLIRRRFIRGGGVGIAAAPPCQPSLCLDLPAGRLFCPSAPSVPETPRTVEAPELPGAFRLAAPALQAGGALNRRDRLRCQRGSGAPRKIPSSERSTRPRLQRSAITTASSSA